MNTPLSPAAQAVLTEFHAAPDNTRDWYHAAAAAGALRAAADSLNHATSAHTLYAIADELEGVKYDTYRCDLEGK
jgi:hypothetical protein